MKAAQSLALEGSIYHLFPLGVLGAPRNQGDANDSPRSITEIAEWIPHLKSLSVGAVLLGPVFSSESHGYDILDPYRIDPRLGTAEEFTDLVNSFHEAGIDVLLDAVMNHVGRGFFAFQDILTHGKDSQYVDWFHGLDFSKSGPQGEPFAYETWDGHSSLIKLNIEHEEVVAYLLGAVTRWITEWGIDGLRLDAADVIAPSFWPRLREHADSLYDPPNPRAFSTGRFWMFGEMVHGDYRQVASPGALDSATNFEAYKGMYSSFNDGNMFEIAWSLDREFGPKGLYRNLMLYNFVDNHDVPRIASTLRDTRDLYPLHILLFSIPGIPSIYYGSETGVTGEKGIDDWPLRPRLRPESIGDEPDLLPVIRRLSRIHRDLRVLSGGSYRQVFVDHHQLLFVREDGDSTVYVAVNGSDETATIPVDRQIHGVDRLNSDEPVNTAISGTIDIPPKWGRIIEVS